MAFYALLIGQFSYHLRGIFQIKLLYTQRTMMENQLEKDKTYVLFGNEAIRIYNISLRLLLSSAHVDYKVGVYTDVKEFVAEAQKWDGFIEIEKIDYMAIQQNLSKSLEIANAKQKKRNKLSIFKFFK